jgi:hypothetical protein
VFSTNSDPTAATPTFVLALQARDVRHLPRPARGSGQAERMWMAGKSMLQEAMTRHDQQMPKRAAFNSRMTAVAAHPPAMAAVSPGWSGTGTPN